MKTLRDIIAECDGGCTATAGNTMGMGNPMAPGPDGEPGSGDIPNAKLPGKKKKKYKTLKEFLAEGLLNKSNKEKTVGSEEVLMDLLNKWGNMPVANFEMMKDYLKKHEDIITPRAQLDKNICLVVYHPQNAREDSEVIEIRKKNDRGPLCSCIKFMKRGDNVQWYISERTNQYRVWSPKWSTLIINNPDFITNIQQQR